MKSAIGEYGRIILLVLVLVGIIIFTFGRGEDELLGMLQAAKPTASVGNADSIELVGDISKRKPPSLNISTPKLSAGTEYNLLNKSFFRIEALNEDNEELPVSIVSIKKNGEEMINSVLPEKFVPIKGKYYVTYHTEETYKTLKKETNKTVIFVAD